MSLTWAEVDRLARQQSLGPLTERLLAMSEPERLAFGADVEQGVRATRGEDWWGRGRDPAPAFALAVIACMPSAARAAALLTRSGMRDGWGAVPEHWWARIVAERELTWQTDLGVRLAARLPARDTWARDWQFVATMLRHIPEAAPRTEGFVRGWLDRLADADSRNRPFADNLRASPFLDVLLPAVFEIDGLGGALPVGHLGPEGWDPADGFAPAVVQLVTEGRLDRAVILAAVRDRLVRGDRPAWLRPFTEMHEGLAPALAELTPATGDYCSLLSGGPGPVAGLAQRALRAIDDAGLLEFGTLMDASVAALQRTEKGLVKAQLTWLDKVARREPGRAGEVMETIAVAFGHPGLDVQERALTLIGKRVAGLDPATVARIADAAGALAGDLPARAAELFGAVEAPSCPPELVPPVPPAAMPPPITGAAELAGEIVALLHHETAVAWERVMAALVTVPDLTETLAPLLTRESWIGRRSDLYYVIKTIVDPSEYDSWRKNRGLTGGPTGVLVLRLREMAGRITTEPVPLLLATPTRVDGSLDAATLLERLLRAETEGWTPWPVDLEQALLRLPRDTDVDVTRRAAELTSPAGRRFATWLKDGGMPDPVSSRWVQSGGDGRYRYGGTPPFQRRVVVQLDPVDHHLVLAEGLFTLVQGATASYHTATLSAPDVVTAVLPHHREVTAAWALPAVAALADLDQRGTGRVLPLLAESSGPTGPAMTLALAYGLGARGDADRLAAVDAFLILAARPEPFAPALGAEIGDLCADGTLKLTRVLPGLAEAHRVGASAAVWQVLRTALPVLLPAAPRGLPDLLELATLTAGRTGAHDSLPGLAEAAARPGGSRVAREARRLLGVLSGVPA
ncbi:DUF6493 family protein [Actinoplanes sp. G11-F43]|uniref:DUF6493 family protein n=1 Tax=Actinoplanes sp. G11-F43 TaxID=3424130 RepID=UPI003D3271F7